MKRHHNAPCSIWTGSSCPKIIIFCRENRTQISQAVTTDGINAANMENILDNRQYRSSLDVLYPSASITVRASVSRSPFDILFCGPVCSILQKQFPNIIIRYFCNTEIAFVLHENTEQNTRMACGQCLRNASAVASPSILSICISKISKSQGT